jgi:hypothetical protein
LGHIVEKTPKYVGNGRKRSATAEKTIYIILWKPLWRDKPYAKILRGAMGRSLGKCAV